MLLVWMGLRLQPQGQQGRFPVKFSYRKHYLNHVASHAEGHIYFDVEKGPCIFHLVGAASMSQEQLDQLGEVIAKLLSSANPSHFSLLNK